MQKVMQLVNEICNVKATDCRSLNKAKLARQLMDIANIPKEAEIQEIPLDWDNQVVILFLMPNDTNYYSLFSGIGTDGKFYFQLSITGIFKGNVFEFFNEDRAIDIDYFINRKENV